MGFRSGKTCSVKRKSKSRKMKQVWKKKRTQQLLKKSPTEYQVLCEHRDVPDLYIAKEIGDSSGEEISGRRIIDVGHFFKILKELQHDGFQCSFFDIEIMSEKRYGLRSTFLTKCKVCGKTDTISTESGESNINESAVCGAIATGIGYSQFTELCSALNIPAMSSNTYKTNEERTTVVIRNNTSKAISEAGKEEKALAVEQGDIDEDGVPFISVIVDGAWSKRSYKTNYNALSGVACIIGARTKKILYLGVKNKYCEKCQKYSSVNLDVPPHTCYMNWKNTSTAMESRIILEGFQKSEEMHGLRYKRLIGDGDSSVYSKIKYYKPYGPNYFVEKIECRNHILRNYCNKLKEFSKSAKIDTKLKAIFKNVLRFRTAVVSAVKFRKNANVPTHIKITYLKEDILNGPKHILGYHEDCKEYFCQQLQNQSENLWTILKSSVVFEDFQRAINRVASNAYSLLHDMDTNIAESYNSVVNKLVGGKRINFSRRGSYETRCLAAATNFNTNKPFFYSLREKLSGKPRKYTERFCLKKRRQISQKIAKKFKLAEPDSNYGIVEDNMQTDKNEEEISKLKTDFLLQLENSDPVLIEINTRGQSSNPEWYKEKSFRITSSNFGKICKMRSNTSTVSTIKNILYTSNSIKTPAIQHGNHHENIARELFSNEYKMEVMKSGLFIHPQHKFLAASPDGLVDDDAILEIKCPYSAKDMSIVDAIKRKIIDYCYEENGVIKLKQNHNYMYQIQGLLEITNREHCYFFIYTLQDYHCQLIQRDQQFWNEEMVEKLKKFYFSAYLLELLDSRYKRELEIRDIKCGEL